MFSGYDDAGPRERPNKPIDRWLTLVALALSILLYLFPKTLPLVVGLMFLVFLTLLHPIWNFWWIEDYLPRRISASIFMAVVMSVIGFNVPLETVAPVVISKQVPEIKVFPLPIAPTVPPTATNPRLPIYRVPPASAPADSSNSGKRTSAAAARAESTAHLKPVTLSLKARINQVGNDLDSWMIDKQAARPEVNYAQSDPRMTREQNTELMARQIRAQSEFDRQTLIEFHERFAGKLVALSNDLKGCGIDVGSLPEEIQHIDPPEVNWGVINGILNNLGGFAEKLPDNDADLSCKP